jgi:hypothetical protein
LSVSALGITKGTSNDTRDIGWTNFRRDTELKYRVRLEGFDAAKIHPPASMALGDIEDFMLAVERGQCSFRKLEPREVYGYEKELQDLGVPTKFRKTRTDVGKKRGASATKVVNKKAKNSQPKKDKKKKKLRRQKKTHSEDEESDAAESSESDNDSVASEVEVCGYRYTFSMFSSDKWSRFRLPKQRGLVKHPDVSARASGQ